jgi:hypothetical protein
MPLERNHLEFTLWLMVIRRTNRTAGRTHGPIPTMRMNPEAQAFLPAFSFHDAGFRN